MRKIIYAIVISVLIVSIMAVGMILLKKKTHDTLIQTEEITIEPTNPEPTHNVDIIVKQKDTVPQQKNDISASEFKNFEDTIDELIVLTQ